MKCDVCLEAMSAELDGELGDAEGHEMRAHVAGCTSCAGTVVALGLQHRLLRVRMAEAVPDLTEAILASAGERPRRFWSGVAIATSVAAAVVVATAVVTADQEGSQNSQAVGIEVHGAHASIGREGGVAEAYLYVSNPGEGVALESVSSPVAERAELHATRTHGDVHTMIELTSLGVPSGGATRLSPGGTHIMLVGLHTDIHSGDQIPITLHLSDDSVVEIVATALDDLSSEAALG